MPDRDQQQAPNADEATGLAFAGIPYTPAASALGRPPSRVRSLVVSALVATAAIGAAVVYLSRPTNHVDPNAPRVVAEVTGMHCPVRCGLRVAASLERLTFVRPGSVTADPKTGIVTFAVAEAGAASEEQVRRAIEQAGFGVGSIKIPAVPLGVDREGGVPPSAQ